MEKGEPPVSLVSVCQSCGAIDGLRYTSMNLRKSIQKLI
jgi:hypothetical protein